MFNVKLVYMYTGTSGHRRLGDGRVRQPNFPEKDNKELEKIRIKFFFKRVYVYSQVTWGHVRLWGGGGGGGGRFEAVQISRKG